MVELELGFANTSLIPISRGPTKLLVTCCTTATN